MARPLSLNIPIQNLQFQSIPVSFLFVIISVFSVFSTVAFLCASHRKRKSLRGKEETIPRSSEKRLLTKLNSNISSKAHTMAKMISWKKMEAEEEEEQDDGTRKSLRGKVETISGSTDKRLLTKLNSNISSKAHTMVKMISWKKVRAEEEESDDGTEKSRRGKEETTSESSDKRLLTKLNSSISSKAHMMVKMISWKKVQAEEEEEEEEEDDSDDAVWRRKIIMGERCRPLNFSGKIVYDSEGNLLPDSDSIDRNRNQTIV